MNEKFEASSDVKSQLKFIEELDKIEKKRHEEQEWEKIMKAAKVRYVTRNDYLTNFSYFLLKNKFQMLQDLTRTSQKWRF